jgi:hypothetical protein
MLPQLAVLEHLVKGSLVAITMVLAVVAQVEVVLVLLGLLLYL